MLLAALFWRTYLVADRLVLYDCITLTIATMLYVYLHMSTGERRLLAIPLATATLVAGALLQGAGASFTAIWHFNQNDIFHLAMMVALPAYYIGADPNLLPPSSPYGRRLPARWSAWAPLWRAGGLPRRRDSD